MHIDLESQDLAAAMTLEVSVEKPEKIDALSKEKSLFTLPVPGAGLAIKDVFRIGLSVELAVAVITKLKSGITIRAGIMAAVPGTSKMALDVYDLNANQVSGFERASVDPVFKIMSLSETADFSIAAKPKLIFGIEIFHVAKFNIAAIMNFPELKTTATVVHSRSCCGHLNGSPC